MSGQEVTTEPRESETPNTTALVTTLSPELTELLAELKALSHLGREDRPIPVMAYNVKLKDATGNWIPQNVFFDTVSEETHAEIRCVLLDVRKTRRNSEYIEGVGTRILCRSRDSITGEPEEGGTRECATCPLKDWQGGERPDCQVVYNFLALDLDRQLSPFLVKAKSTSLGPARRFLAQNFWGKLKGNGVSGDLPLFTHITKLTLTMPSGNYAVLKLALAEQCSEADIRKFLKIYEIFKMSGQPNGNGDGEEDIPF